MSKKKKSKTTQKESKVTTCTTLEGVNILRVKRVETTFEVTQKVHRKANQSPRHVSKKQISKKVEILDFSLTEVTSHELADFRKNGDPFVVYKKDGRFYYSKIPADLNLDFPSGTYKHNCAIVGHECSRLSAASDENGGCEKVRQNSVGIELYPWITEGIESSNTLHDSFLVLACSHFVEEPPRTPLEPDKVSQMRLTLAEFYLDYITDPTEVHY